MDSPKSTGAAPADTDGQAVNRTVSAVGANVAALGLFAGAGLLFIGTHVWRWDNLFFPSPWVFVPLLAAGIIVHEGLHGLGFLLGGAARSEVKFGIAWSKLMPYANCRAPMSARAYRVALALPGVGLGLLPAGVGLTLGWWEWTLFGTLMLGPAGGDAAVLWAIRRVPAKARVIDHPTEVGCRVLAS
jgi:hypothetical protein